MVFSSVLRRLLPKVKLSTGSILWNWVRWACCLLLPCLPWAPHRVSASSFFKNNLVYLITVKEWHVLEWFDSSSIQSEPETEFVFWLWRLNLGWIQVMGSGEILHQRVHFSLQHYRFWGKPSTMWIFRNWDFNYYVLSNKTQNLYKVIFTPGALFSVGTLVTRQPYWVWV